MMDIYSKGEYPASALSNFAAYDFVIDGVPCRSMEGFLQSLKYKDPKKQKKICLLCGKEAKAMGEGKRFWKLSGRVFWQGQALRRTGAAFADLIDRAYAALAENVAFRAALLASGEEELTHRMGKKDPHTTILTEEEFVCRLQKLRREIAACP